MAWLSLLAVAMNLFVLKQISLFGLNVTACDALAVGYLLGLNLIQEFFGRQQAQKMTWLSFFISAGFLFLSQIHLAYQPNRFDHSQNHFAFVLQPVVRIFLASLFSFLCIQFIDIAFFSFLRKKFQGQFLTLRTTLSLILSQTLDTVLFSFLALSGVVPSLKEIILFSLLVKGCVILLSSPFVAFSKKVARYDLSV